MIDEPLNKFLLILTECLQDDIKSFSKTNIEKINNGKKLDSVIYDFLQHVNNEETRSQMQDSLNNIKSLIKENVNNNNLFVLQELNQYLDDEMELLEIPADQREHLKNSFMAYIQSYIAEINPPFSNHLALKEVFENGLGGIEEKFDQLTCNFSKREELCEENYMENFMLRISNRALNYANTDKMIERKNEKENIQSSFDKGSNIVFLNGRPGMGKTTLAKMYANECGCEQIYFVEYEKSMEYTIAKLGKNDQRLNEKKEFSGEEVLTYWENLNPDKRELILLIIDNFDGGTLKQGIEQHYTDEVKSQFFKRLKDIGIHVLITTRISMLSESSIEVGSVNDTMELFIKHYKGNLTEEQRALVKKLIEVVQENTLLIVQAANIWNRSDTNTKYKLVEQLKKCQLKNNNILLEDKTLYEQVKSMLDFSGINADHEREIAFASAALLPLKGEHRDKFIEMSGCDINKLNWLIDGSWILIDSNERISMHPVVKEVAIQIGLVTYENCEKICNYIHDALDLKLSLADRYPFVNCAWEIYQYFSVKEEINDTLIHVFYRLSDIYDNLGDHERSMEIINTVEKNLHKINIDIVEKARMLSGIAYSINNSFKSMEELDRAMNMLMFAQEKMRELPEDRRYDLNVIQTNGRIWSNLGSNNLSKSKCIKKMERRYLDEALKWHKKALNYRLRCLDEVEDGNIETIKKEVATSYTTIATDYYYMGEYEKSIQNHLKASGIREEGMRCINQQRIIGCLLEWYKKSLAANDIYWKEILDYYPALLKVNYKYDKIDRVKENLNYFREAFEIVQNDRRLEKFANEMNDRKRQIIDWMEETGLNENFKDLI